MTTICYHVSHWSRTNREWIPKSRFCNWESSSSVGCSAEGTKDRSELDNQSCLSFLQVNVYMSVHESAWQVIALIFKIMWYMLHCYQMQWQLKFDWVGITLKKLAFSNIFYVPKYIKHLICGLQYIALKSSTVNIIYPKVRKSLAFSSLSWSMWIGVFTFRLTLRILTVNDLRLQWIFLWNKYCHFALLKVVLNICGR